MSKEIVVTTQSGLTLYGVIREPGTGKLWRPSITAFETYTATNYNNASGYATAISFTEQGSTGTYFGDFPTGITTEDDYPIDIRKQVGGSPATTDLPWAVLDLRWDGSAVSKNHPSHIWAYVIVGAYTAKRLFRWMASVLMGKSSGFDGNAGSGRKFRSVDDTNDDITVTVDGTGNRTAVTLDD